MSFERAVADCTAVADADVFFPDFDGINLVFNQQGDAYGRSRGGGERLTKDGQTQFYGVTWMHSESFWRLSPDYSTRDGPRLWLAAFLRSLWAR